MTNSPWKTQQISLSTHHLDFETKGIFEVEIETEFLKAPSVNCLVKAATSEEVAGTLILFAAGRMRNKPILPTRYEYWGHASKLPANYHLIFVSDPALKIAGNRDLTYGVRQDFDGIKIIAEALNRLLGLLQADNKLLNFFGFSQGGFFALQVASYFEQSKVLAHCPATKSVSDIFPTSKLILEEAFDSKMSIEEFAFKFPERYSVWERFKQNQPIPEIYIHTNRQDQGRGMRTELAEQIIKARSEEFDEVGKLELKTSSLYLGHRPYPIEIWEKLMKEFLAEK